MANAPNNTYTRLDAYVLVTEAQKEIEEVIADSTADSIVEDIKDVGVDSMADAIKVVGAALDASEAGKEIQVNFTKPEVDEEKAVNKGLYKNSV